MGDSPPLVLVNGSPSLPSRTGALLEYVGRMLGEAGERTRSLALRDLPASDLVAGRADAPALLGPIAELAAAPGVVLATPIYKAAYSGLLKIFLDLLPQFALEGKIVLPLATGGSLAHVLALDYALRPVLSSLGARHVVPGFFVLDKQLTTVDGLTALDPEAATKLSPVLRAFTDSLRRHRD